MRLTSVRSVTSPAGTIDQTCRGFDNASRKPASCRTPDAPMPSISDTAASETSYTTTRWPPFSSRWAILPPIRPSPIIAISMSKPSAVSFQLSAPAMREAALEWYADPKFQSPDSNFQFPFTAPTL